MVKKHLKRLAAPKSWPIARKHGKFTVRPLPSGQGIKLSLPLRTVIRDVLGYAENASQVKRIMHNKEVLVDGRRVSDARRAVGLMDVLSFPQIGENFRVLLDARGKLVVEKISADAAKHKVCMVVGKRAVRGNKVQLALHDGRTLLTEKKDCAVGDSLLVAVPSQDVKGHFKFEKGANVYLVGGRHVGKRGVVDNVKSSRVAVKSDGSLFEVKRGFAFVVEKK